jgi:Holliday junction resolvase RusA-like endonuclease
MWPPEVAEHVVTFVVLGEPKPAGSKTSGVAYKTNKKTGKKEPARKPDGRIKTFTKDSAGTPGKTWRSDIRDAVKDELGEIEELLDGPLVIETRYFVERPDSHYGTGRNAGVLKANKPRYPHSSRLPDGTKLLRAVEDALNKVLIVDDRRFCRAMWSRDYGRPRAEVTIWRLPELVGDEHPESQVALAV